MCVYNSVDSLIKFSIKLNTFTFIGVYSFLDESTSLL